VGRLEEQCPCFCPIRTLIFQCVLLLHHKYEGRRFLRNSSKFPQQFMASHVGRHCSWQAKQREPQILSLHDDYKWRKREYLKDGLQVSAISGVVRLTVLWIN
jgi:hypothetical protein